MLSEIMVSAEVREMLSLGEAIFLEGIDKLEDYKIKQPEFIHKRHELIIKKRLAVVEFAHGLELILKAILIKKGYSIFEIKNNKIFKTEEMLKDVINNNKTISLYNVIDFFKKNYPNSPFESVEELRLIRNQIIHKGTNISEKKTIFFIDAINCLEQIYALESIKHKKFLTKIKASKYLI